MRDLISKEQKARIRKKMKTGEDLAPEVIDGLKQAGFSDEDIDALRIPQDLQEPEEFVPGIVGGLAGFFPTMLGMDKIDELIDETDWEKDKRSLAKALVRVGFGVGTVIPFALTVQGTDPLKRGIAGAMLAMILVTGWKSVELVMDVMAKKKDTRLSKEGETLLKKARAAMKKEGVSGTIREEEQMPELRYALME